MRTYDLVMTHKLDSDDFFIHRVQQHCAERGFNFFLVEPLWAEMFLDYYQKGEIWAKALLNMQSEHHQPGEIFHRLVRLAEERKTKVIDPLGVALAAFDKARLHDRLKAAGYRVPETVMVARERAGEFRLSDAEREMLGEPFVIKPSMGYGKKGVIMDAVSERDLERSMAQWPDGRYLLQRRIEPRRMPDGRPGYFRVFYVFGSTWSCWWNCYTDGYSVVSAEERAACKLGELDPIARGLAQLTGMNFFSTEIAQTEAGEFILIDYVNDQCHMLTQSSNPAIGVPDEVVRAVARAVVDGVERMIRPIANA